MRKLILLVFLLCYSLLPVTVNALTFKKGEVLGPDGKVYTGASPEQQEKLIEKAKNGGAVEEEPPTEMARMLEGDRT